MKQVLINNQSTPLRTSLKAGFCASFLCRLRGLTFRSHLSPEEGLLLVQARENRLDASIHMLTVWIDLGVIWIDAAGVVVDTVLAKSWHAAYVPRSPAKYVLEIHPERMVEFHLGDRITFEEIMD